MEKRVCRAIFQYKISGKPKCGTGTKISAKVTVTPLYHDNCNDAGFQEFVLQDVRGELDLKRGVQCSDNSNWSS